MNLGKTLFAQLMEFVPWTSFARIVARYSGDARNVNGLAYHHFHRPAHHVRQVQFLRSIRTRQQAGLNWWQSVPRFLAASPHANAEYHNQGNTNPTSTVLDSVVSGQRSPVLTRSQ